MVAPTAAKATVFLETISKNTIPKTVKITGSAGKEVEFRREELPNVIKVGETFFKMKIQAQGEPKAIKFPDVDNDGERNYFYDIGTEYKDILGSIDGCQKVFNKSLFTVHQVGFKAELVHDKKGNVRSLHTELAAAPKAKDVSGSGEEKVLAPVKDKKADKSKKADKVAPKKEKLKDETLPFTVTFVKCNRTTQHIAAGLVARENLVEFGGTIYEMYVISTEKDEKSGAKVDETFARKGAKEPTTIEILKKASSMQN